MFLINPLPNGKILDWSKFKVQLFADDKINVTVKMYFVLDRSESILGKGKDAGYQHFFLLPKCFQMHIFQRR